MTSRLMAGVTLEGDAIAIPNGWASAFGLAQPALIQSLGFNSIWLNNSCGTTNNNGTTLSAFNVTNADFAGMVAACAACSPSMSVIIKPQLIVTNGDGSRLAPYAIISTNASWTTAGVVTDNSGTWNLTNANVGQRIVCPPFANSNSFPGSAHTNFGLTAPPGGWNTIVSVQSPTQCTIAQAPPSNQSGQTVYILDDSSNITSWFANWLATMTNNGGTGMLDVCVPYGNVLGIDIAPEMNVLLTYYESEWRTLIAAILAKYPALEIVVQVTPVQDSYAFNLVSFYDALSYITFSCYPPMGVQAGGSSLAALEAGWESAISNMAAMSAAWNKQILWAEVGSLSIVGGGFNQDLPGTYTYGANDQANYLQAMLNACSTQPWFAGWCLFQWAQLVSGEVSIYNYPPNPATLGMFQDNLVATRFVTDGSSHYR